MNRDRLIKILAVATAVIVVAYFGVNVYQSVGDSYKTATAVVSTVSDTVEADMFVIRDEILVDSSDSGVVVPLAVNGERVSNGGDIAAVFSSEEAAENYSSSISLNQKLETYEKINNEDKLANLDLDKLNDEVDADFYSLLDAVYYNDYSDITDDELSFSERLSRKNVSLGYEVDCTEQISDLQSRIAALNVVSPEKIITAESAGYFVSRPDGYENILTTADVDTLTAEQLQDALSAEKSETDDKCIGKIIQGYEWYIAAEISSDEMTDIETGKTMTLILGDGDEERISAKLYSKQVVDEDNLLVIFKTSYMNESLATIRKVTGKIVVHNYKGIKIRKEAVRFDEDGNEGVYILEGNVEKFNRIEELYSNDSVVVAADKSGASGWLAQYDEIIISGKGLSDGKVIS